MKKFLLNTKALFLSLALLIAFSSCKQADKNAAINVDEINAFMHDYREAWRQADSAAVLNKLSSDIILFSPTKTGKPISSKNAVSEFWFPKSDITYPILEYIVENEDINGSGHFAYYQGTSKLKWCTEENGIQRDTTLSVSEFTNILKKENNTWKIYRIMYNLKDTTYTR